MRGLIGALLLAVAAVCTAGPAWSQPETWFAPPDPIAQSSADFHALYENPSLWSSSRSVVRSFSVTANYLLDAPLPQVSQFLDFLKSNNIRLLVSLSALPVNKSMCGEAVEGIVWPGEPRRYAEQLKQRGVAVDGFALDLPLIAGHVFAGRNACRFTIEETAKRLAEAIKALHAVYPNASIIDEEVPTGLPQGVWEPMLAQWLSAYRNASGHDFDGFTMDIWWEFPWRDVASASVQLLHQHGIRAGLFIDADGHKGMMRKEWTEAARRNACDVVAAGLPIDYAVVANWMVRDVPIVPESDPNSLTSLLGWFGHGPACGP